MKNLVSLWPNLFHIIEIAKVGGYSLSVHFGEDYKNGYDDYQAIKSFCEGFFENFVTDGHLKVEIVRPKCYEVVSNCETLADISKRIEKAILSQRPDLKFCTPGNELLKTATSRLNLSLRQVENVKQTAATIAQMDKGSKKILVYHIAEAVICSHKDEDACYDAEPVSFGGMIEIRTGEIDKEHIKYAINYLNKLL